jgi:Ca2+-binding RTX toxin-like protein
MSGNAGDDNIESAGGLDTIDGGDQIDSLVFDRQSVLVNLTLNMAATNIVATVEGDGSTIVNVERIVFFGAKGADTITWSNGNAQLNGFDGNDKLTGGILLGGEGDDTLNLNVGGGVAYGEAGDDVVLAAATAVFCMVVTATTRCQLSGPEVTCMVRLGTMKLMWQQNASILTAAAI